MQNQGLPTVVCKSLDIFRQYIKTLSGMFKDICVIADVIVLTTLKF